MSKDNAGDRAASPGSVGEEALRLLDAMTSWAGEHASAQTPPSSNVTSEAPDDAAACDRCAQHQSPGVCRVCPVCRIGSVLESLQPEVIDRVADLVAMFAGSLHAAAQNRRSADDLDPESTDHTPPPSHDPVNTPVTIPLTDSLLADETSEHPHD